MGFGLGLNCARSRTYVGGCSRGQRGEKEKPYNSHLNNLINKQSRDKTEKNNNEIHVRRNLLNKSEDLLEKILKIGSDDCVQEFPSFSSLKKNQKNRYYKEHKISSENDFIKHIFQLCKNYLDKIKEQNRRDGDIIPSNVDNAIESLIKLKEYLKLKVEDKNYISYEKIYSILEGLQILSRKYFEI